MRNRTNIHGRYGDATLVLFRIFLGFVLALSCFPTAALAQEDSSLAETGVSDEEVSGEGEDISGTEETSSNAESVAEEMALYDAISLNSASVDTVFTVEISGVDVSFRVSAEGEVVVSGSAIENPGASGPSYNPAISTEFEGSLTIPTTVTYDGTTYTVVGIGNGAFYYCEGLTGISLPAGITSIGAYAFYYCEDLTEISLPENLVEIGQAAFFRCGFTSLYIPASVKTIGSNAFRLCHDLETLTFAEGCVLTSIGSYVFSCGANSQGSLKYVEFPEANTIPAYCFQYQTSLETVTFRGESYYQIGSYAFSNCTSLKSISIPNLTYTAAAVGTYAFQNCTSLTDVIWLADAEGWGVSTSSISTGAHPFYGCTSITNVVSYGTRWVYSSGYGSGGGSVADGVDVSYPSTEAELHYYYNVTFYGSQSDAELGSNALSSARLRDDVSILQISTSNFEEGQVYGDGGSVPSLSDSEAWLFENGLVVDDVVSESCYAYKVNAFDLTTAQISFSKDPYYYVGTTVDVEFTVTSARGDVLSEGTDFTITSVIMGGESYDLDNILLVGTYTLSIEGAGSYTGSTSASFTVDYATVEETAYDGDDLVAVAASISSALYASASLTTVLLVPTDCPEIALACSVYAAQLGWSILFVEKDELPYATWVELRRMRSTQAIVLGSTDLVDNDVITEVRDSGYDPSVSRISVSDAAEAAYELWVRLGASSDLSDASTVYLCASLDAASAVSAYAARVGIPILFCEESGQVSAEIRSLLKTSSFENMVVVGGTSSAAQTLSSIVGNSSVQYSVITYDEVDSLSIQMAELMEEEGLCETGQAVVAGVGDAAGSGLAALLAASLGAVMLLVDNDEAGATVSDNYLSSRLEEISDLIFVGTEDGLTSSTRQTLLNMWELLDSDMGSTQVTRLAGTDRYATMAAIVAEGWTSSRVAVLVSGENWPDALSASALAGLYDAPILLTESSALPNATRNALKSLGVTQVYIVGGEAAVSARVANQLTAMGISYERIYGDSRVETAYEVYSFGASRWGDTAFIATSQNYADALSASSIAYAMQAPIFLVDDEIDESLYEALSGFTNIVILGGTAAVSEEVASSLPQTYGITITRLGGSDRYETSRRIAEYAISLGMSTTAAGVASGANFPDALAGAALCGRNNSVVLLVQDSSKRALTVLSAHPSEKLYIFGGTSAVSTSIEAYLGA